MDVRCAGACRRADRLARVQHLRSTGIRFPGGAPDGCVGRDEPGALYRDAGRFFGESALAQKGNGFPAA